MICRKCNTDNPPESKFCENCGASLKNKKKGNFGGIGALLILCVALFCVNSGVLNENIDIADICTCCNSDELHSHRATAGKRGNLAAIIALK